jgi:hypothetical protein
VIFDDASPFLVAEAQLLEIFRGNAGVAQGWVTSEPEPPIVGGVAQDNTSARMERSDTIQAGFDQRPTNAATLFVGAHGNRAEPVPVNHLCVDLDRGKGDVPYKLAFVLCVRDMLRAPPSLRPSTIAASLPLLWGAFLKALVTTARIAGMSLGCSLRIIISDT